MYWIVTYKMPEIFGRVRELLKTVNKKIYLYFTSNAEVVLVFSELINNSRTRPDF
jgi:hypothetical protein